MNKYFTDKVCSPTWLNIDLVLFLRFENTQKENLANMDLSCPHAQLIMYWKKECYMTTFTREWYAELLGELILWVRGSLPCPAKKRFCFGDEQILHWQSLFAHMAEYWPRSVFAVWKHSKRELGQYGSILPSRSVNNVLEERMLYDNLHQGLKSTTWNCSAL